MLSIRKGEIFTLYQYFDEAADAIVAWNSEKTKENEKRANTALKNLKYTSMDPMTIRAVLNHLIKERTVKA